MQSRFRKKPVGTALKISCVHFLPKEFFFISDTKKVLPEAGPFYVKPENSDSLSSGSTACAHQDGITTCPRAAGGV